MTDIPHFALPFRFATPEAAVVEQDSIDEIAYCAYAILACPLGFRVDLPEFGLPDLTFTQQPVDVQIVAQAIEEWEPRALVEFTPEELVQMAQRGGG